MSNKPLPTFNAGHRNHRQLALLLCGALLCTVAQAQPTGPGTPGQALEDYYRAVDLGDCARALALRPGYSEQSCRGIEAARLERVDPLRAENDRAALTLSVRVTDANGERPFDGLVGLRRCADGQWRIMTRSFQGITDADPIGYGEQVVSGRLDSGPTCAGIDASTAPPAPSRPNADNAPTPTSTPARLVHGSELLLKGCWDAADLSGQAGEDQVMPADPARAPVPPALPTASASWSMDDPPPPFTNIRGVELSSDDRAIALTFNLIERPGEVAGYDAAIVELLRERAVPATFFASGRWLLSHRERALQPMADPLFELGSLGFAHRNLAVADPAALQQDLLLAEATQRSLHAELAQRGCAADAAVGQALHLVAPAPRLYRMPYGRCDDQRRALTAVAALDARTIQWSLVLDDIADNADSTQILHRAREGLEQTGPGSILVAHADGRGRHTATALRELLLYLEQHSYEPVTVSELLRRGKPIQSSVCFEHQEGDNLAYDRQFPD